MPAINQFKGQARTPGDPAPDATTITPSDTTDLEAVTTAVHLSEPGDLSVITLSGQVRLLEGLGAGWHPLRVSRIRATGTTASRIVIAW
ncbi:MAG: hypothetical protein H5U17_08830 [Defluviimonas sp.]|nr:hypothetical protein [Defluviimonas sp.]